MKNNIKLIFIIFIIFCLQNNIIEGKKENKKNEQNQNAYDNDIIQQNVNNNHEKTIKNMAYAIATNPAYQTDNYCYWDDTTQMYRIRGNDYWNSGWQIFFWILFLIFIFSIILCFPCWDYEGYYYGYRPYYWGWRTTRTTKYTANQYNQNYNYRKNNSISSSFSLQLPSLKENRYQRCNYYI